VWGYGTRPHEWYAGMRNLVAPGALTALFALLRRVGVDDPRIYLTVTHALVGALSLTVVVCAYDLVAGRDLDRARLVALCLALWVPWQNLAFRTLGETFSAVTLMLALRAWSASPRDERRVGLWLSMSFVLRYPAGLFAPPFVAALLLARDLRGLARLCVGALPPLALLALADHLAWGAPFHSVLAYADFNLLRGRAAADYGSRPAWFYLACTVGLAPLALLVASLRRARLADGGMSLAVTLTYLAAMSCLGHKEPRFFLSIVAPLTVAAGLVAPPWSPRARRVLVALTALHALAAAVVYHRSNVCEGDATRAAERIGREPSVTSVALVGVSHPGYVHLHRDVPITGDPRNEVRRSLATLDTTTAPREGRFAIARGDEAERGLRARGWTLRYRLGVVGVWALAP
jgi:GPI mannosyltransferase 3